MTVAPLGRPFFLDAGFMGDESTGRTNTAGAYHHQGPFVGLGIRF